MINFEFVKRLLANIELSIYMYTFFFLFGKKFNGVNFKGSLQSLEMWHEMAYWILLQQMNVLGAKCLKKCLRVQNKIFN